MNYHEHNKGDFEPNDKIKCKNCGWEGIADDLEADCSYGETDEMWSNWICPKCKIWQRPRDYLILTEGL